MTPEQAAEYAGLATAAAAVATFLATIVLAVFTAVLARETKRLA